MTESKNAYFVKCQAEARGDSIKLVTTKNDFLSISGIKVEKTDRIPDCTDKYVKSVSKIKQDIINKCVNVNDCSLEVGQYIDHDGIKKGGDDQECG